MVHPFNLCVRFWVIGGRDVLLNAEYLTDIVHEFAGKLRSPIRYDFLQDIEKWENLHLV